MNPGTLTKGHTYYYDSLQLTYLHETINHYVFSFDEYGQKSTMKLNFTQVKNNVTYI